MIRWPLRFLVAGLVLIAFSASASATFHLVKVVDVFPGTAADPTAQYVMLQMYFPGQNLLDGHKVEVFDASGTSLGTFTFMQNVSNGTDLATILIATSEAQTLFGLTADLTMTPVIDPAGGAVCWDVIDCVSWGNFSAPAGSLPGPLETPFNPPDGLVLGMAMHRDLSPGGATTSFAFAAPAPENNAGQVGMLSETPTVPPQMTPTPTVTPQPVCVGDCGGTRTVAVNDLIRLVSIALGGAQASTCMSGLPDGSAVNVTLIIQAVNNALYGCPS